jgi:hypothetical protein
MIGNVDFSTWLVLTITNNSKNTCSDISNLNINLINDNRILSDPKHPNKYLHIPINGHVPDGTSITFMETHKNFTPKIQKLINGQAIFRLKNNGNTNITAICDNQTVSTNILVNTSVYKSVLISSKVGELIYCNIYP